MITSACKSQDVEKSLDFYLRTFAAIGMHEAMRFPVGETIVVGLAGPTAFPFLAGPAHRAPRPGNCTWPSGRPTAAAVDAVHEAAVAAEVEVVHAPREFPEYHPGYYGVFLRDPDGHNVEAVHHG